MMKIALVQFNPTVGDFAGNVSKILSFTKKRKADLYVFPELSLSGYCPQDLVLKKQFVKENLEALHTIKKKTNKNLILGFIDGKKDKLYNAAAFISNNKIKHTYYKQKLPNYSVFDEKRWFTPGTSNSVFTLESKKIALNICEDIWTKDVCKEQLKENPDLLINISASPYSTIKLKQIEKILLQRYKEVKKPILYVNQVGAQDGLVYHGHSMFVNRGRVLKRAKDFREDVLVVDL